MKRMNAIDNMLAKALKYLHRWGIKRFEVIGINGQSPLPIVIGTYWNGHRGSDPEALCRFPPRSEGGHCIAVLYNLRLVFAQAGAGRALSQWLILRPTDSKVVQVLNRTPGFRGNSNRLTRPLFRDAHPGEVIYGLVRDCFTDGLQQKAL